MTSWLLINNFFSGCGHSVVFNRWTFYFYLLFKSCFWGEVQVRDGSSIACLSTALSSRLQRSHLHEGARPLCLGQCFKLQGMWWLSWSPRDTSVNKAEGRKSLYRRLGCKKQKYSSHQALRSSVAVHPVTQQDCFCHVAPPPPTAHDIWSPAHSTWHQAQNMWHAALTHSWLLLKLLGKLTGWGPQENQWQSSLLQPDPLLPVSSLFSLFLPL